MKIDMRVGTVIKVEDFKEARTPAYKVWVDFGELGVKKSSAQVTKNYTKQDLMGKQVVCVVNFPLKQVANFLSEILIMGAYNAGSKEDVVLLQLERKVENGSRIA